MKVRETEILFIPGAARQEATHWQTRWQSRLSTGRRLELDESQVADPARWTAGIAEAVNGARRPVVLVAHGAGVTAAIHAVSRFTACVAGAFLVAPADPASEASDARAFQPFPRGPLPFPSLLVASRDDPSCGFERAEAFAADWGSLFIDAGNVGRIDAASGHGPWPEGSMTFARFVSRLRPD